MKMAPTEAGAKGDGDLLNTGILPDPAPTADLNPLLSAARGYLARGLVPIRLSPGLKKPPGKFEDNTVTADNADRLLCAVNFNLGLRLGDGLVDFDLDWPQARRLGGLLLDRFPRFGRAGAPGSHYLARCSTAIKSRKYDIPELKGVAGLPDEHAVCVLEVRASPNAQTMAPPSVHPNGEAVVWENDPGLTEDNAEGIYQKAGYLAFLSVVARFYPAQGSRDDFCMALSGALLAAGLSEEQANRCVVRVAEVAGDEEAGKRGKAGQTAAKMAEGEPVTGIPRVVEMLGLPPEVAKRFRKWLGIKDAAVARDDARVQVVYSLNRLHETMAAAEDAVIAAGVPIYRQAGRVVRAARLDEAEDDDGVRRPAGALLIRGVKQNSLRATMTSVVNFVSPGEPQPVTPHISLAQTYLEQVAEGGGRLPVLRGIVECPTLRPDGTILSDDGYDRATGTILDTGGVAFDPVPDEPTLEEALVALGKIKKIDEQFPYKGKGSRSVALSGFLTAVCRRSLPTAPMHGFSAPAPGTGKSLLCDCIAMLAMGRQAAAVNQSGEPGGEEERKALMSILMQGDPVVVIDNITRPVTGRHWCSILTSPTWQDRLLGGNDNLTVSTRTLWLANGNNLEFREDMSRRAIICTLDAEVEKPEERGGFDLDLKVEVPGRRGELVAAALTILRAFIVAGRPGIDKLTPFAGYEEWSDLVRGALVWLGEDDPCATRVEVTEGDSAREELADLLTAWEGAVGVDTTVTTKELLAAAQSEANEGPGHGVLLAALDAVCPRGASPKSVGWYLKRVKGLIRDGRRIVVVREERSGLAYKLEKPS